MTRRAFVLPLVLALTLAATIAVATSLNRLEVQRRVVERQIQEYRRHHDMLGARDMIRFWLSRRSNPELSQMAASFLPAHRFSLPGGSEITLFIADGQGLVKSDLAGEDDVRLETFGNILMRLPEQGRVNLIRSVGPAEISINAAPREVLEALSPNAAAVADMVIAERARAPLTLTTFRRALDDLGYTNEEAAEYIRKVAFEPTLWKLTAIAQDPTGAREFTALVEIRSNGPAIHEWREHVPSVEGPPTDFSDMTPPTAGR